jgi:hypothetical protein
VIFVVAAPRAVCTLVFVSAVIGRPRSIAIAFLDCGKEEDWDEIERDFALTGDLEWLSSRVCAFAVAAVSFRTGPTTFWSGVSRDALSVLIAVSTTAARNLDTDSTILLSSTRFTILFGEGDGESETDTFRGGV